MLKGWRLALGFLTVIPVRPVPSIGRREAAWAMILGPLAVAPIALAAAGLGGVAFGLGLPSLVSGLVVIGVMTLGTRAMHLDGLADTVDGLGSGVDRGRALEVMRRGDVGPMGVVALVLVLGAQAVGAGSILTRPWGWLLVAMALSGSRAAVALGCVRGVPAARPEGLGALFAGTVGRRALVAQWCVVAAGLAGAAVLAGQPWWQGTMAAIAATAASGWLLAKAVRRLGGVTGDVLGALVETSATVALVAVSATVNC